MIIYIDKDFKCHTVNDGTMIEVETEFFNNKSKAFIEGYRFIPSGMSWTRSDGVSFSGEAVFPWKDYRLLETAQTVYEEQSVVQADTDAMLVDYEYRLTMLELGITE